MALCILVKRNSPVKIKCHNLLFFERRDDSLISEYPLNETNITFIWLSSPYSSLKIEYPPPYIRKIWNFNKAEIDLINLSIEA